MDKLYSLTVRQWQNMKLGYEYRVVDQKRINAEAGWAFAYVNNGKKLTSYLAALDVQESKIGKTKEEIERSAKVKRAVYSKQMADLALMLSQENEKARKQKEKEAKESE